MKISLNKTRVLGTLPGSNPPELAWHDFDVRNDSGFVGHLIDGHQRAMIDCDKFADYVASNSSFDGVVVTAEETPAVTVKLPAVKSVGKTVVKTVKKK